MAGGLLNIDTALGFIAGALEKITGIPSLATATSTRAGRIARIEHVCENAVELGGGVGGASAWGDITGTLADQTDLAAALDGKQVAGAYLVAADLAPYATSAALTAGLAEKQPTGDYATNTALANVCFVKRGSIMRYRTL